MIKKTRNEVIHDAIHNDEIKFDTLIMDDLVESLSGSASLFTIETNNTTKTIPVSQDIHYAYRGEYLKLLSLLEYVAIIEIIPLKVKSINISVKIKRQENKTYEFQKMHPLHASHTQRVRSKLLTPVLVGGSPKNFNSIDNNDMKQIYKNCSITENFVLDFFCKNIVVLGDFFQIIPVGDSCL